MIRNGMGSLPMSVHPRNKNKLMVDAIGLRVTTHWEANPLSHAVLSADFLDNPNTPSI